jgi:hypothetical protein
MMQYLGQKQEVLVQRQLIQTLSIMMQNMADPTSLCETRLSFLSFFLLFLSFFREFSRVPGWREFMPHEITRQTLDKSINHYGFRFLATSHVLSRESSQQKKIQNSKL